MKLTSNFSFRAIALGLLLTGMFIIPMKGNSQVSDNTYALTTANNSYNTDVSAYLSYDSNLERYTLNVSNPSRKKLKIYFSAGGTKYLYRASLSSFTKPFDLKGADDGVYTFAIQDGSTLLQTDVQIKTTHITKRETVVASRL